MPNKGGVEKFEEWEKFEGWEKGQTQLSDGEECYSFKSLRGDSGEFSAMFVVSAGKRLAGSCIGMGGYRASRQSCVDAAKGSWRHSICHGLVCHRARRDEVAYRWMQL